MSRKDPRKSLIVCPGRPVWVALKAQAGCGIADQMRRVLAGVNWADMPEGTRGKGVDIALQLPAAELQRLEHAARAKGVSPEVLVLGALERMLT